MGAVIGELAPGENGEGEDAESSAVLDHQFPPVPINKVAPANGAEAAGGRIRLFDDSGPTWPLSFQYVSYPYWWRLHFQIVIDRCLILIGVMTIADEIDSSSAGQ
jgi:hypothetical protein